LKELVDKTNITGKKKDSSSSSQQRRREGGMVSPSPSHTP